MEFWGIEVKPGQTVKCEPGKERVLHLSQASLGVNKKEKGSETVQIFVKVNDQKLVIGTLSTEKCTQIQYDLVFQKDFELSHGSKSTSVFFVGYRGIIEGYESDDSLHDSPTEDDIDYPLNGTHSKKVQGTSMVEKAGTQKVDNEVAKLNAKTEKPKKEQVKADNKVEDEDDDSDEDDDDDSDDDEDDSEDSDEDMVGAQEDSSDEDSDEDDSSSEEEASPVKVDTGKKRKPDSAAKTPIHDKKAKMITPVQNQKTGGDGKKGGHVHVATPYPSKQGGKPQQTPKSEGSVICKSCNRNFNSENALQAHSKAKHGVAAAAAK